MTKEAKNAISYSLNLKEGILRKKLFLLALGFAFYLSLGPLLKALRMRLKKDLDKELKDWVIKVWVAINLAEIKAKRADFEGDFQDKDWYKEFAAHYHILTRQRLTYPEKEDESSREFLYKIVVAENEIWHAVIEKDADKIRQVLRQLVEECTSFGQKVGVFPTEEAELA